MSSKQKTGFTELATSEDLIAVARLCRHFNRNKIYEIFGEYCGLTSDILRERHACGWLYYEDSKLNGFALGRCRQGALRIHEAFVLEEIWAPCDGMSTELGRPSRDDSERVGQFRRLIELLESSVVLRASVENHFAHLIARMLKAQWINGLILAERRLKGKVEVPIPTGFRLRMFENGDQHTMARIHGEVFAEGFSPKDYKSWATASNCRTIVATRDRNLVGFIIAEKRRCGSFGDFMIAVEPCHHRKGLGSALLHAAFNAFIDMRVKKVIADYLMLNAPAHHLYRKHNFKPRRIYNYFLCKKNL